MKRSKHYGPAVSGFVGNFIGEIQSAAENSTGKVHFTDDSYTTVELILIFIGFKFKELRQGKLIDEEKMVNLKPGNTENYYINDVCDTMVITENDQPDEFATGWLNDIVKYVLELSKNTQEDFNIVRTTILELEKHQLFQPIKVIQPAALIGEQPLKRQPGKPYPYFVKHLSDSDGFESLWHIDCGEMCYKHNTATPEKVLWCPSCGLQISFPTHIEDLEMLREYQKPN